jgi:hypothetical protein
MRTAWVDFIPESKQNIDKDGFLLCRDVPVARTGVQLYGPGETPIDCADGQMVQIDREAEEVFHPETLASMIGVPVVNDHPVDGNGTRCDVTPDNWRHLAVGHVENPRRGDGPLADFMLADLRIHDSDAIKLIQSGKRQVSAGYDAEYEETGPLRARQTNIRCNHLALVDAARCGQMCAIGDSEVDPSLSETQEEEDTMSTWHDRIRGLAKQYSFKSRDTAELESAIADAEEAEKDEKNGSAVVHVHVPEPRDARSRDDDKKDDDDEKDKARDAETEEVWEAIEQLERAVVMGADAKFKPRDGYKNRDARRTRMGIDSRRSRDDDKDKKDDDDDKTKDDLGGADLDAGATKILAELEMEAPTGAQVVDVRKARDSRFLEESWTTTISKGEIIVPGSRPRGTFDRAAPRMQTYDAICGYRRAVLDMAYVQPDARQVIDNFTRGRFSNAKDLTCGRVREVFDHVAEVKRATNNSARAGNGGGGQSHAVADTPFAAGGASNLAEYQKQIDDFYTARANERR